MVKSSMCLLALFNTLIALRTPQTLAPFLLWEKGLLSLLTHSARSSSNSFSLPYCFHASLPNFRILSTLIWAQDQIAMGCFCSPAHACYLPTPASSCHLPATPLSILWPSPVMAHSSGFLGAERSWIAPLGVLLWGCHSNVRGSRGVAFHPYGLCCWAGLCC